MSVGENMISNSTISIIVPVYNVEKELDRCIQSLLHQTYKNIEIILVDDGSPDDCPRMCDEYAKMDARVRVIHKSNGGLSDARNMGLKKATGEYVLFVDSDDYIRLDSCQRFVGIINDCPDIVVAEATIYRQDYIIHQKRSSLEENITYNNKEFIIKSINSNEWYAPVCYNLYNRLFLINNELFFEEGILHEDVEYMMRLYLKANKINFLKYEFYQYVIRENSITQSEVFTKNIKDCNYIYSKWKKTIDEIKDVDLKEKLYCVLSKYYISSCRRFKNCNLPNPKGISNAFLLKYSLTPLDFIKSLIFVLFRKLYVNL